MARYNPMQSVVGQAGLQLSGQGLAWEGKQRGLGRQAIQEYLEKQARASMKAGGGIGLSNILGKGAGLLTMYLTGNMPAAAAVSGGISGLGGLFATKGLSKEEAPDVLYGTAEAEEAESYAHQAIDTLIGSIAPKALTTAITTPLEYLTLQQTFNPTKKVTEEVVKGAGKEVVKGAGKTLVGKAGANAVEASIRARLDPHNLAASKQYGAKHFLFGPSDNLLLTPPTLKDYLKNLFQ